MSTETSEMSEWSGSYSLSDEGLRRLTSEVADTQPVLHDVGGVAVFRTAGTDPLSDLGRVCEQRVFDATFGHRVRHDPAMMAREYGPYEVCSEFFIALVVSDSSQPELAGALRVIRGIGNKALADLECCEELTARCALVDDRTWEVGTISVMEHRRRQGSIGPSLALYRACLESAEAHGVADWFAVIDEGYAGFFELCGVPFVRVDGFTDLDYLGSTASLFHLRVSEARISMIARRETADNDLLKSILNTVLADESAP